ncbi:hypothetical protein EDC94DRAFT_326485 [Helicostylum pulchrum]|nr:hypothetical protein EDC94DRAFT_326485 [Helicostylum pulchrum]
MNCLHEERPNFNLMVASDINTDSLNNQLSESEEEVVEQEEEDNSNENKKDELKEEEDDANKEDELKEEEEDIIYYKDLITGNAIEGPSSSYRDTRDVAIVTVTKSDNIEFTKLIQVAMEGHSDNGPLLDLHVSLFGDTAFEIDNRTHQEEFQDTIRSIEMSLSRLESFKTESQVFLQDHMDTMDSLNLYSTLPRNLSFPNLSSLMTESDPNVAGEQASDSSSSSSSSSSGYKTGVVLRPIRDVLARREAYDRNAQSMYAGNTEHKSRDPFDQRQKEIISLVVSLKKELYKFKSSLEKSEDLVNDVQIDMDDTRNRMETYIKDIPESHYSA